MDRNCPYGFSFSRIHYLLKFNLLLLLLFQIFFTSLNGFNGIPPLPLSALFRSSKGSLDGSFPPPDFHALLFYYNPPQKKYRSIFFPLRSLFRYLFLRIGYSSKKREEIDIEENLWRMLNSWDSLGSREIEGKWFIENLRFPPFYH